MYINKKILNSICELLKIALNSTQVTIENLKKSIDFVWWDFDFIKIYATNPIHAIETVKECTKVSLPPNASISEIKNALESKLENKCILETKIKCLLAGLSKEGFKKVTYSLPLLLYICRNRDISASFMLVTGIAKNAEEKHFDDELMNSLERELYALEIDMAKMIEADFSIKRENMGQFLTLYREYLKLYKDKDEAVKDTSLSMNFVEESLFFLSIYIVFSNVNYDIAESSIYTLYNLYETYKASGIVDEIEALCLATDILFYEIEKLEKRRSSLTNETSEKNDPLSEFVADGFIVKSCDLKKFEELLNSTKMTASQKDAHLQAMSEFIEMEKNEALKNAVTEFKKSVMSEEEIELYNLARCYRETEQMTNDVDAIIELLMSDLDEENRELLLGELNESLAQIKRFFAPAAGMEDQDESIIYYTCSIEDAKGVDVKIPCLLRSIIADKTVKKYEVDRTIREIVTNSGRRERKIKGIDLPYTIYMQGQDIRIFYTRIKDTTVIIDMAYDAEVYDKAIKIANTKEFRAFLAEVESYVASGHKPNAQGYTDLIKTTLNRGDKIMKLI